MKKFILVLILACGISVSQAGICQDVRDLIKAGFTLECGYILLKCAAHAGYITLPKFMGGDIVVNK